MTTYESSGVNEATRALINIHNSPLKPTPFKKVEGTLGTIGLADVRADISPVTDSAQPPPDASADSASTTEKGAGPRIMSVVRTLASAAIRR